MINISDLPLSDEIILNIKHHSKIMVISQLVSAKDEELLSIKGIGKKQLKYIKKAVKWYNELLKSKIDKNDFIASIQNILINEVKELVGQPIKSMSHEINELRTILLEQYRLIQSIQIEKQPEGINRKINESIPGFSAIIHDLYKKLEEK